LAVAILRGRGCRSGDGRLANGNRAKPWHGRGMWVGIETHGQDQLMRHRRRVEVRVFQ